MRHITAFSRNGTQHPTFHGWVISPCPIYQELDILPHFPGMEHNDPLSRNGKQFTPLSKEKKHYHTFQGYATLLHFPRMRKIAPLSKDGTYNPTFQGWETLTHFPGKGNLTTLFKDGTHHPTLLGWDISLHFAGMIHISYFIFHIFIQLQSTR